MIIDKHIVVSTTYLGPIEYFVYIANSKRTSIETYEHYIKQTWRNRCSIYTANGIQNLSIPVIKVNGNHTKVRDVQISDAENWQLNHWRAIVTAYNHSPYFLYYRDELEPFFSKKHKYLLDLNSQLLEKLLSFLEIDEKIKYPANYIDQLDESFLDLRNSVTPKKDTDLNFPCYMQVFSEKHGFLPNLSILDLLFNLGPDASRYLSEITINAQY